MGIDRRVPFDLDGKDRFRGFHQQVNLPARMNFEVPEVGRDEARLEHRPQLVDHAGFPDGTQLGAGQQGLGVGNSEKVT